MATPQKIEPQLTDSETEVQRTEHPHIVRHPGIAGGEPIIDGTRIRVELVARFIKAGTDPWEIIATYPHLRPAAVFDAISYYFDHREEIDHLIEESARLAAEYEREARERRKLVSEPR